MQSPLQLCKGDMRWGDHSEEYEERRTKLLRDANEIGIALSSHDWTGHLPSSPADIEADTQIARRAEEFHERPVREVYPSPERTATVLAVSPLAADRVRLREILSRETGNCMRFRRCEALELLRDKMFRCSSASATTPTDWEDL